MSPGLFLCCCCRDVENPSTSSDLSPKPVLFPTELRNWFVLLCVQYKQTFHLSAWMRWSRASHLWHSFIPPAPYAARHVCVPPWQPGPRGFVVVAGCLHRFHSVPGLICMEWKHTHTVLPPHKRLCSALMKQTNRDLDLTFSLRRRSSSPHSERPVVVFGFRVDVKPLSERQTPHKHSCVHRCTCCYRAHTEVKMWFK